MAPGNVAKDHPWEYFSASALAAVMNYPIWRAAAIGQSGFAVHSFAGVPAGLRPYLYGFFPPYKGMVATVGGMTWARAAIFWGSDTGRELLLKQGFSDSVAIVAPPLIVSTIVQIINQPLVRATVTIQNPNSSQQTVLAALKHIFQNHGVAGLWHGTLAAVLKTVPKYCTAIIVKDEVQEWMDHNMDAPNTKQDRLWRSAYKSVAAGVAGAALTNPLDVIRNEMFKTNLGMRVTIQQLHKEMGYSYFWRGMGKNMIAVALPVGCTIFFTDAFIEFSKTGQF